MHYYNGLSAAEHIGISYKTLLRWIEKGRIVPEESKTPTGQLVISENQVEQARIEWQMEQARFIKPKSQTVSDVQSQRDDDIDSLMDQVQDLDRRVSHLEAAQSRPSIDSPSMPQTVPVQQPQAPLYRYRTDSEDSPSTPQAVSDMSTTTPKSKPQILTTERTSEVPANLPPGTLSATDFAEQHGIKKDDLKNYMRRGISGQRLDITEVPHPTRPGYVQKFLTAEQQEAVLDLLRRHGKLPLE